MLFRESPSGLIVVSQPMHSWVSGQLARGWGNERFGTVEPREAVGLGAEQHDLGWVEWEAAPTLNPRTGRPYRFFEMPLEQHLSLWSGAGSRALTQGRYAALLVSLHVSGLYGRRDGSRDTPEQARQVAAFLAAQKAFQDQLLATLREDPIYAPFATDEAVARNQALVAVWDRLSLALCGGLKGPLVVENVPAAEGATPLTLAPVDANPDRVTVDPWPFSAERVPLVFEGRRLVGTFLDESTLRSTLARAPWLTLTAELLPADQRP